MLRNAGTKTRRTSARKPQISVIPRRLRSAVEDSRLLNIDGPRTSFLSPNGTDVCERPEEGRDGCLLGGPESLLRGARITEPSAGCLAVPRRFGNEEPLPLASLCGGLRPTARHQGNQRDFLPKACSYQLYFNLARPTSRSGNYSRGRLSSNLIPFFPMLALSYILNLALSHVSCQEYPSPRYPKC